MKMFDPLDSEIYYKFIRDEIQRERDTLNRQVIDFIKEKGGCGEFVCMTCGGLWGFRGRFREFIEGVGISLSTALSALVPEDLLQIRNWQNFVSFLLAEMSQEQKDTLFRTWVRNWGKVDEFDKFVLDHLLPEGYLSTYEGKQWAFRTIFLPISMAKVNLFRACTQMGKEFDIINIYFKHAMMENAREKEVFEQTIFESWKQNNQMKYFSLLEKVQSDKKRQQEAAKIKSELQISQALEQKRIAEIKEHRIHEITSQEPVQRLITLLDDECLHLDDVPIEWSQFDLTIGKTHHSSEITRIISSLSHELSQMQIKEKQVQWRELRSKLYTQRQTAMKREHMLKIVQRTSGADSSE
jgi:hypothetical protein